MKTKFILPALLTLSFAAFADVKLEHIANYQDASNAMIWKKVSSDDVPEALVMETTLQTPSKKFQTEDFLVCYKDCAKSDPKKGKDAFEQQNVYYWVSKFYEMAKARFDLTPRNRTKVLVSRDITEIGKSKKSKDNAFFNPADGTLTFLPASWHPLRILFGGAKINRSGFDPSVIAHEAGHSLFDVLFPGAVNQEIDGFNEGFADYMANILLNNPKVGLIMLRGKALRDSSSFMSSDGKLKTYAPELEVHDLGERFASALWLSRAEVQDVDQFDKLVISAIKEVAVNPFATSHSFKTVMNERIQNAYDSETANKINALWELFFPGKDTKITDMSFLTSKGDKKGFWGVKVETNFSEQATRDMGLKVDKSRYTYVRSVKTKDGFVAHLLAVNEDTVVRPYWILMDPERKNAIGAWSFDGTPVTLEMAADIKTLATSVKGIEETLKDFLTKANLFTGIESGKGQGALVYKVKEKKVIESSVEFNGEIVHTKEIQLKLKRKLLGKILGIPSMNSVKIITIAGATFPADWPKMNEDSVIGITLVLDDGTEVKTMMELMDL